MNAVDTLSLLGECCDVLIDALAPCGLDECKDLWSTVLAAVLEQLGFSGAYTMPVSVQITHPVRAPIPSMLWATEADEADQPKCKDHWVGHRLVVLPNVLADHHAFVDRTITLENLPGWDSDKRHFCRLVTDGVVSGKCSYSTMAAEARLTYWVDPDYDFYCRDGSKCLEPDLRDIVASAVVKKILLSRQECAADQTGESCGSATLTTADCQ
jgi:hypothetical protein